MPSVATKLTPTADGGWMARKRIPAVTQETYERLYGVRWEARFRCGPMAVGPARAKHREWLSEVEARIANIQAERKGEGSTLTEKQARALSGEWYTWWVAKHSDRPSPVEHWRLFAELLTAQVIQGARERGNPDDPHWDLTRAWEENYEAREPARAMAADWAETTQFLHAKRLRLDPPSRDLFLDYICRDLLVALDVLIRRGQGDWSEDTHPQEFPRFEHKGDPSVTPWSLFERWVAEKQPARSAVERWRCVFLQLQEDFPDTSAGAITAEQAQDWCRGLIGPERSAGTVDNVWKSAARTIYNWAVEQKLVTRNPFKDVRITVPRRIRTRQGKAFTPDEIKIILRAASAISDNKSKTQAARRWVPWLCAYTGARSGEITQLRGVDVVEQDGQHAIRITPEAGDVKTREPRTVPLHRHLLEQGFLEFAKVNGKGPLFYNETGAPKGSNDPTNPSTPRYVSVREIIGKWVRELGVTDPEIQPNHAWRHTFKLIGARNGMRDAVLDVICGHAPASEGRGYGKPELIDLAKELKKFPRYKTG